MPQLMPFFWINSTLMVFFILITLVLLYFYKNMEELKWMKKESNLMGFSFSW